MESADKRITARDAAAPDYDRKLASRREKEIPTTLRTLGGVAGKKIIDYGCGTGRLTVELFDADLVLAADFSRRSLEMLALKSNGRRNLGLVLADVSSFRTAPKFFDKAISAQVLEHITSPEKRKNFFNLVWETLKPNGVFVLSAYHYDLRRKMKKLPEEGQHASGIFFHYFSLSEVVGEFQAHFTVTEAKTIDITWPLEARLGLSGKFTGFLSRLAEHVPVARKLGHLVLVSGVKGRGFHYSYGHFLPFLFPKHWFWFDDPRDVSGAAMVNFFSYEKIEAPGFQIREGQTTVIDLKKSLPEIWSGFRPNFISKQIEKGIRNGIAVRKDGNFREFKSVYTQFRKAKHLPRDRFETFRRHGLLFSAYYKNRMIAGGVFVSDGVHIRALVLASTYLTDPADREIVGQANRMLLWEAIRYAKETGHTLFDFGGISPESEKPHLRTLAEFKEAFGGKRVPNFYYFKVYSPLLRLYLRFRGFKSV